MGHWEQVSRDNQAERRRLGGLPRWRRWTVLILVFVAAMMLWIVKLRI